MIRIDGSTVTISPEESGVSLSCFGSTVEHSMKTGALLDALAETDPSGLTKWILGIAAENLANMRENGGHKL